MSVNGVALVLIVCWGAIAIGVVVVTARWFAKWDRDGGDETSDNPPAGDDQEQDPNLPRSR